MHVIISGCSGGGKSTLISELERRGYNTVCEPGRRIILDELHQGGGAVPWLDLKAFLYRAIRMAQDDLQAAPHCNEVTFFDRGLIDAASALGALTGEDLLTSLCRAHRFHRLMFMVPPWPEIYVNDRERVHSFDESLIEYQRLTEDFAHLGFDIAVLPKTSVQNRADFIVKMLNLKFEQY